MPDNDFDDEEFLFRWVIDINWDYEADRPSSATFKDSKGVSVDRQYGRDSEECVTFLQGGRDFKAVCAVSSFDIKQCLAYPKYLPIDSNPYHSEIHDDKDRVDIRKSKARNLSRKCETVFKA